MISLATEMSKPVKRSLPFLFVAQADLNAAQEAVVDIHHALPGDAGRVDVEAEHAPLLRGRQVGQRLGLDAELSQAAALRLRRTRRPWHMALASLSSSG